MLIKDQTAKNYLIKVLFFVFLADEDIISYGGAHP